MKTYLIGFISLSMLFISCQTGKKLISNAQEIQRSEEQLDEFFSSLMDTLNMPGLSVAIINQSKIVYLKTMGVKEAGKAAPIDQETYFEAASLSKPVFAYFVMKQVEKGLIDLDKPLYQYLPYPDIAYDERYKTITARMVLSHSSGFPNWREDSLKIQFEPGTNYLYSGEGYKYLAQVIAAVNEVPFSQLDSLFQQEVAHPIGASKLRYLWNEDIAHNKASGHQEGKPTHNKRDYKDNDFGAAGGLNTEAESYAKYLISIFEGKVISPELTREMFKEQMALPEDDINAMLLGASGWSLGYGMIPTKNGTCYWHAGNNDDFQSWMHFYPDKKYGIVLFTNSDKIQHPIFFDLFFNYMEDGFKFDFDKLK
ncbi:MAG: serine hydrolase domain-containing protein [Bacteroidota bacterium]